MPRPLSLHASKMEQVVETERSEGRMKLMPRIQWREVVGQAVSHENNSVKYSQTLGAHFFTLF